MDASAKLDLPVLLLVHAWAARVQRRAGGRDFAFTESEFTRFSSEEYGLDAARSESLAAALMAAGVWVYTGTKRDARREARSRTAAGKEENDIAGNVDHVHGPGGDGDGDQDDSQDDDGLLQFTTLFQHYLDGSRAPVAGGDDGAAAVGAASAAASGESSLLRTAVTHTLEGDAGGGSQLSLTRAQLSQQLTRTASAATCDAPGGLRTSSFGASSDRGASGLRGTHRATSTLRGSFHSDTDRADDRDLWSADVVWERAILVFRAAPDTASERDLETRDFMDEGLLYYSLAPRQHHHHQAGAHAHHSNVNAHTPSGNQKLHAHSHGDRYAAPRGSASGMSAASSSPATPAIPLHRQVSTESVGGRLSTTNRSPPDLPLYPQASTPSIPTAPDAERAHAICAVSALLSSIAVFTPLATAHGEHPLSLSSAAPPVFHFPPAAQFCVVRLGFGRDAPYYLAVSAPLSASEEQLRHATADVLAHIRYSVGPFDAFVRRLECGVADAAGDVFTSEAPLRRAIARCLHGCYRTIVAPCLAHMPLLPVIGLHVRAGAGAGVGPAAMRSTPDPDHGGPLTPSIGVLIERLAARCAVEESAVGAAVLSMPATIPSHSGARDAFNDARGDDVHALGGNTRGGTGPSTLTAAAAAAAGVRVVASGHMEVAEAQRVAAWVEVHGGTPADATDDDDRGLGGEYLPTTHVMRTTPFTPRHSAGVWVDPDRGSMAVDYGAGSAMFPVTRVDYAPVHPGSAGAAACPGGPALDAHGTMLSTGTGASRYPQGLWAHGSAGVDGDSQMSCGTHDASPGHGSEEDTAGSSIAGAPRRGVPSPPPPHAARSAQRALLPAWCAGDAAAAVAQSVTSNAWAGLVVVRCGAAATAVRVPLDRLHAPAVVRVVREWYGEVAASGSLAQVLDARDAEADHAAANIVVYQPAQEQLLSATPTASMLAPCGDAHFALRHLAAHCASQPPNRLIVGNGAGRPYLVCRDVGDAHVFYSGTAAGGAWMARAADEAVEAARPYACLM